MPKKIINKKYNINNKKIKKETKIFLMSDIHISKIFKKEKLEEIMKLIKKELPDYICIPGDVIDSTNILEDKNLEKLTLNFIKELSIASKVIISIGNHDMSRLLDNSYHTKWKEDRNNEFFQKIKEINNVHLLDNETYINKNINFVGFTPSFKYYKEEHEDKSLLIKELNSLYLKIPEDKYNILLCHSPIHLLDNELLEKVNLMKNIDLILSGHMHNGMVHPLMEIIWKGNRGIITPNKELYPKAKITRGIKRKNDKILIISGGVTKISSSAPNVFHIIGNLYPSNIEIINLNNG